DWSPPPIGPARCGRNMSESHSSPFPLFCYSRTIKKGERPSQLWNYLLAKQADRFQGFLVRRSTGLAKTQDQIIGLDFCLPALQLLQTVFGRAGDQAISSRFSEGEVFWLLDVLQILVRNVSPILEVKAMRVHGRSTLRLSLLHAAGNHRIPHETNVGFAARLLRRGTVAGGIVFDHRQRLYRVSNPAISHPGGTPQSRRSP